MNFLSYLSQHPVNSVCYIIVAIGYIIALINIYKKYRKTKKLSHTQKGVLIALGCSLSLLGPPQFLDSDSPSSVSILIGLAVFAFGISLPVIIAIKVACRTNKKGR